MTTELDESLETCTEKLMHAEADLKYALSRRGTQLAEQEGYKDLDGLDAIRYYLMQKHNWLPAQVKALNFDDLYFAMSQES